MARAQFRAREAGFGYVMVLFLVAIASILSVRALENGGTQARREREEELLFVGSAYREAIRRYHDDSPGTAKEYPATLEALLLDPRTSTRRRPLRQLYRDPMTGDARWGLVLDAAGRVTGVYSLSTAVPLKRGGFDPALAGFAKASSYQDWKFVYAQP